MSKQLKIGVVGVGWFGSIHVEVWNSLSEVALVSVCDKDPSRFHCPKSSLQDSFHEATEQFADMPRLPPHCKTYSDLHEMLEEERLDVVDITVTETDHFPVAQAALKAGCHVIVEKPLTLSHEEGQELKRLSQ